MHGIGLAEARLGLADEKGVGRCKQPTAWQVHEKKKKTEAANWREEKQWCALEHGMSFGDHLASTFVRRGCSWFGHHVRRGLQRGSGSHGRKEGRLEPRGSRPCKLLGRWMIGCFGPSFQLEFGPRNWVEVGP